MKKIFKLPDLGEGLAEAIVREWYVNIGDTVNIDQPLVSMETDKALVDIPSPFNGKIVAMMAQADDIVKTDAPFIEFEIAEPKESSSTTVVGTISETNADIKIESIDLTDSLINRCTADAWTLIEYNQLDLNDIETIFKQKAIIHKQDILEHFDISTQNKGIISHLNSIRKSMYRKISEAHKEVAQVTLYDDAIITHWPEKTDFTVAIIRAIEKAIAEVPIINSTYHNQHVNSNDTINCGIAMDSEHGLFVPVIHDIKAHSNTQIREKINSYKLQVKQKQLQKQDTLNPTILLSNFGMFGAKYATPMVMPPMVAIIGIGQSHQKPMVIKNELSIAKVLPISLSVDHRYITGGEAARFLSAFIEALNTTH